MFMGGIDMFPMGGIDMFPTGGGRLKVVGASSEPADEEASVARREVLGSVSTPCC